MKRILLFSICLLIGLNLYSQEYNNYNQPIPIKDFLKGINDFDYFRSILIERGFIFEKKNPNSEFWNIKEKKVKYPANILAIQMSIWEKANEKNIRLNINKDYMTNYNKKFSESVKQYFNEKTAQPFWNKEPYDDNTIAGYTLIYYKKDCAVIVEYEEDEGYFYYVFRTQIE